MILLSIVQAIGLFLATNIDDIIVLSLFYARGAGRRGTTAAILAGQYLGFGAILAAAVLVALGARAGDGDRHVVERDILQDQAARGRGLRVGVVRAHREARVDHEDAAVGPGGKEAAVAGGFFEVRVVFLDGGVHIL